MKTLKYIFYGALVFLVIKAFYLDKKIEEYKNESNATAQTEEIAVMPAQEEKTEPQKPVHKYKDTNRTKDPHEKLPLDKVGDTIADELDDKIKIPDRKMPSADDL